VVAGLVEVAQIERVVPDLVNRGGRKKALADLEFNYEDHVIEDQQRINASAKSRNLVLQVQPAAVEAGQRPSQQPQLTFPGLNLLKRDVKGARQGQRADDFVVSATKERRDVAGIMPTTHPIGANRISNGIHMREISRARLPDYRAVASELACADGPAALVRFLAGPSHGATHPRSAPHSANSGCFTS